MVQAAGGSLYQVEGAGGEVGRRKACAAKDGEIRWFFTGFPQRPVVSLVAC